MALHKPAASQKKQPITAIWNGRNGENDKKKKTFSKWVILVYNSQRGSNVSFFLAL